MFLPSPKQNWTKFRILYFTILWKLSDIGNEYQKNPMKLEALEYQ